MPSIGNLSAQMPTFVSYRFGLMGIKSAKNITAYALFFVLILLSYSALAQQNMPEAYYRLTAALEQRNAQLAQAWIDSCKRLKPQRVQYETAYGIYALQNNDYSTAIEHFSNVEQRRKGEGSLWLTRCYAQQGDTAAALRWLQEHLKGSSRAKESAILLDPLLRPLHSTAGWKNIWNTEYYNAVEQLVAQAEYLIGAGHADEALELLNARIKGTRGRYTLFALRGDAQQAIGAFGAAADSYKVAYRKSKQPVLLAKRAEATAQRGLHQAALKLANRAVEQSPNDPKIRLQRANVLMQANAPADALDDLRYYLSFYPTHERASKLLVESALAAEQYVTALQSLAKLIKLYPDNPELRYMRASVLLRTEQPRLAIADLDFAIQHDHRVADAYYSKGLAHLALGEREQACTCWSIAKQRGRFEAQELHYKHCQRTAE